MNIFYDIIFIIYFIFSLPAFLFKLIFWRKYRKGLGMRFGILPDPIRRDLKIGKRCIWLHAVSVGEITASRPLLEDLRTKFPEHRLVISTTTETGNQVAMKLAKPGEIVIYFPLDMRSIVRRVINDIKPEMFLMMETEIWPNFIGYLHKMGIPMALVNGRISQRSFKGYMLIRWLISGTLKKLGLFCMQTESDAQRIIAMGAPRDRVKVTGNMKFDIPGEEDKDEGKKSLLRNYLKLANGDELFVAGSTHKGEDEIILRTYKRLADRHNHLRLLIAPRHLERLGHIERLTQRSGFVPVRFSQMQDDKGSNVILLDTIGQLKWIYSAATIVFIGGSLVPQGGHNMIEPASLEKPLLFGPHVFNFQEVANVLLNRKGAILVKDEKELIESCERLLSSSEERLKMGRRAKESISENRGATSRNVHLIASSLLTG